MAQVLNSDAELEGQRILMANAALTNAFAGVSVISGSLSLVGQPRVRLRHSTTQPIAHNTATACTFNTELTDVGGLHDSVTPTRVTIPTGQGGTYLCVGSVEFVPHATGVRRLQFRRNGANEASRRQQAAMTGAYSVALRIEEILVLAAGDYVELFVFQDSGGVLNIGNPDAQAATTLSLVKVA